MRPTFHFLFALVVCYCAFNTVRADDLDDDDDNTPLHSARSASKTSHEVTTPEPDDLNEDQDWEEEFHKFDIEKLSPNFIKRFDPDYKIGAEKVTGRANNQGVCLKDLHVRVMTKCLVKKFHKKHLDSAAVKNHLRRFIHLKNVRAWWEYLRYCGRIRLSKRNVEIIVKCYLDAIPT